MKKYYAANNRYGSSSSDGFCNTWFVLAFDSKQSRDEYIDNSSSISAIAITRNEVINYAKRNYSLSGNAGFLKPKPFSVEFWGVTDQYLYDKPKGCVGEVTVVNPYEGCKAERFYK